MGGESFGVISIFISLVNITSVLDLGIGVTLNKELAKNAIHYNFEQMSDTLRSLEIIYLPVISTILLLLLSSSTISTNWLNYNTISSLDLEKSFIAMAITIGLQLLINFYSAGVSGLQYQVFLSSINSSMVTLRYIFVIPILLIFPPTPLTFFFWQITVNTIHLAIVRKFLWKKINIKNRKPSFDYIIIKKIWRFSTGVSIINLLGMITINTDKIFLSKILTLEEFGYYSTASIIALSIAPRLASPFHAAVFPRFTQYVKENELQNINSLYHRTFLSLTSAIIPVTLFILFYSKTILFLWTGSETIAAYSENVLILLTAGCFFTGIMYIPYALQLAYGWTKLATISSIISLITNFILILFLYPRHNIEGVALAWLIINSTTTVICLFITHKHLIKDNSIFIKFIANFFSMIAITILYLTLSKIIFTANSTIDLIIVLLITYAIPLFVIQDHRKVIIYFIKTRLFYAKDR